MQNVYLSRNISTGVQRYKEKLRTYKIQKYRGKNTKLEENINHETILPKSMNLENRRYRIEIQKGIKQLRNNIS